MSPRAKRRRMVRKLFRVFVAVCFYLATSPVQVLQAQTAPAGARKSAVSEKQIIAAANAATVVIKCFKPGKRSNGAGVIVSEDGFILTAYHVVKGYADIRCTTVFGDILPARVLLVEDDYDIAVLKVDTQGKALVYAPIAVPDKVTDGKPSVVIGNPLGMGQTIVNGVIGGKRSVDWDGHKQVLREIGADVHKGNSGGGTFDRETGELLGINVAKSATKGNTGYMVATDRLLAIVQRKMPIDELVDSEQIDDHMGVRLRQVSLLDGKFDQGMLITSVRKGSSAWEAGWRTGDVLVGLDKYKMVNQDAVVHVMAEGGHADGVQYLLARGDEITRGEINLGASPGLAASSTSNSAAPSAALANATR